MPQVRKKAEGKAEQLMPMGKSSVSACKLGGMRRKLKASWGRVHGCSSLRDQRGGATTPLHRNPLVEGSMKSQITTRFSSTLKRTPASWRSSARGFAVVKSQSRVRRNRSSGARSTVRLMVSEIRATGWWSDPAIAHTPRCPWVRESGRY